MSYWPIYQPYMRLGPYMPYKSVENIGWLAQNIGRAPRWWCSGRLKIFYLSMAMHGPPLVTLRRTNITCPPPHHMNTYTALYDLTQRTHRPHTAVSARDALNFRNATSFGARHV
jgi:hypothetical protein